MGEIIEPFHGLGSFRCDEREVINVSKDVDALCRVASAEVVGFNFHMGDRSGHLWDGADGCGVSSHGVEAFFQLSDAAKAFCKAGDDATDAFCGEDDSSQLDWVSPRISFSQDLTMEGMCDVEASRSSRVFPEKRKWQEGEGGEADDGCSSEFEFSNDDVRPGSVLRPSNDFMLSADELFLDGKLLPLQTPQAASSSSVIHGEISVGRSNHSKKEWKAHQNSTDEKGEPLQTKQAAKLAATNYSGMCTQRSEPWQTKQAAKLAATNSSGMCTQRSELKIQGDNGPDLQDDGPKHPARHHSLDLLKPVASAIAQEVAPLASFSVDNSPCSSPQRTSSVPSSSVAAPKAVSKQAFRIKDLFKPKRGVSSSINPQLTRDNSTAAVSTCRIPIPPRAFWPFSRSNSAGESKTTTPPPPKLPPRSNSAGESNASRVSPACKSSNEAQLLQACNGSSLSDAQDPRITRTNDAENSVKRMVDAQRLNPSAEISNHASVGEEESIPNTAVSVQDGTKTNTSDGGRRVSGSPGCTSRKKYAYTTANFLRGSPGRRGGLNSFGRMNNGRKVLRNLERCTAQRKLCQDSSSRRAAIAYPVALRVSPVINVAVYRGKMPASGMFGLGSLFSAKKEKAKENEVPVNNWRVGA